MDKETIDAVLNFSGGALVFLAAALPIISFIWAKAKAVPNKDGLKRFVLLIINLILLISAWAFQIFSSLHFVTLILFFVWAVFSTYIFIKKREPVSRAEIFFEAFLPCFVLLFVLFMNAIEDIYHRLPK